MVTKRKQEMVTREATTMREDAGNEDEGAYHNLATRDEEEMPHEEDDKLREDREHFNEEQKGDDVEGGENKAEGREDECDDDKEQRPSNEHCVIKSVTFYV
jgi:hypothetical protein